MLTGIMDVVHGFLGEHSGTVTFLVCAGYLVLLLFARRRMVWGLDEQQLRAQAEKLTADIASCAPALRKRPELESPSKLVADVIRALDRERRGLLDSGGAALRYWETLHEAKRLLIVALTPEELEVRVRAASVELRAVKVGGWGPEATALASEIDDWCRSQGGGDGGETQQKGRALLSRALRILYSVEARENLESTNWHNKILWISSASLLLIVILASAYGHAELLLVGAVGGFLSKLIRLRSLKGLPRDYDSFWTTLFVSGPLGALIGWSGVMLLVTLKQLNLLGTAFDTIDWSQQAPSMADGAAFLLGLSAPLFDRMIHTAQAKERKKVAGGASRAAPPRSMTPAKRAAPASAARARRARR
jgi:hypothetical protein